MGSELNNDLDNDLDNAFEGAPEDMYGPGASGPAPAGRQPGPAGFSPGLGELAGQQIGRYRIERLIGSGGVATVYQAYDQVQGLPVALKVLPSHADEKTYSRFRREALTAGGLRHEHIVRVLQVGTLAHGGLAYMAMEMVDGESLGSLLSDRGALHPHESCNLLEPIARALDHAHRAGIVHRDVKPSNILLRAVSPGAPNSIQLESLDHPVTPLLSDFGVARFLDAPELTSTGRTVGTPAYMAPEQCAGKRDVDGRADIYALGTVLYRCVAGRLPFTGTVTQILHAHVYEPLTIDNEVLQRLPPALVEILRRSLAKNPDDRYATAGEMAQALALAAGRTPLRRAMQAGDATATLTLGATSPLHNGPRSGATATTTTVLVPGSRQTQEPPPPVNPLLRTATPTPVAGVRVAPGAAQAPSVEEFEEERGQRGEERLYRIAWALLPVALVVLVAAISLALINSPLGIFRGGGDAAGVVATVATPLDEIALVITFTPTNSPTPSPSPSPEEPSATPTVAQPTATATMALPATMLPPPPTDTPTLVPTPTATLTPTLTPTPTQEPTPTWTPTLQPTDVATPAPTPTGVDGGAPGCDAPRDPVFDVYVATLDSQTQTLLACASSPAASVRGEFLEFQGGYMLWLDDRPDLYYIFYGWDGTWELVESAWTEGDPVTPEAQPPPSDDLFWPLRGFGKAWQAEHIQSLLGYARSPEPLGLAGLKQEFPDGSVLVTSQTNGQIYAFLAARRQ